MQLHAGARRLLDIGTNDVDQLIGAFAAIGISCEFRVGILRMNVVPDYFRRQAMHRTARSRYLLQDFGASLLGFERAFQSLDLAAYTAHAAQ
jgi:hypothetical protein